jgi:hypothetical protein
MIHASSTRLARAMLIGGAPTVTLSTLTVSAVPLALAVSTTMKLSRYTGALCHGKCGLVLTFEREIVVMLTLCEVQIQLSSGNNIVKVGDVQHLLSVSLVRTTLIHADPAVFLNRRPMLGHGKPDLSHY